MSTLWRLFLTVLADINNKTLFTTTFFVHRGASRRFNEDFNEDFLSRPGGRHHLFRGLLLRDSGSGCTHRGGY